MYLLHGYCTTIEYECKWKTALYPPGLSALSANIIKKYHYVKQLKTWAEAQSYCREKFTDLATVENQDDNDRLQSLLEDGGKKSWIGFCDDLKEWKWALENADFNNEFRNWRNKEPNNRHHNETCASTFRNGFWDDKTCLDNRYAVCYYGKFRVQSQVTLLNTTEEQIEQ